MRALLVTSIVITTFACTAADFEVAPGEGDAIAVDGATDVEIHDSAIEDSVPVDSATTDSVVLIDSTTTDGVVAIDSIVPPIDATPVDSVVATDSVTVIEAGTPDAVVVTPDAIVVTPDAIVVTPDATMTGCLSNASCGASTFCYMVGCGMPGTCGPVMDVVDYGPKCGCDGVTYWNRFEAAQFGIAVHYDGPCKPVDRETCTGGCTKISGAECVFEIPSKDACPGTVGSCWRMPSGKFCGPGKSGPNVTSCGGTCMTACEAVRDKLHFTTAECTVM